MRRIVNLDKIIQKSTESEVLQLPLYINYFLGFMRVITILTLCLVLVLSGCSSCNQAVPLDIPYQALEAAVDEAACGSQFVKTEWVPERWWTLFEDEQLDALVEKALENSPTLAQAQARIASAHYTVNQSRALFFPTIDIDGDVERVRLSPNSPFVPSPAAGLLGGISPLPKVATVPLNVTQMEMYIHLNYEFDFWGKNKNTFLAALGQMQARIADAAFARLFLSIAVSDTYFQLQTHYARREVMSALIANRERNYDLMEKLAKHNLGNDISVLEAQNALSDAQVALLRIEGEIAILEHQLKAYLADDFNEAIYAFPISEKALPKVPLPAELPSGLIAHRPDIISQLWLIESAGRLIDVARAGFYPSFNLLDFVGFQAQKLNQLFIPDSRFGVLQPSFSLPFFHGGRLIANLRSREVDYDLAILQYNQLILDATKEVLDGLSLVQNTNQVYHEYEKETEAQFEISHLTKLRQTHNLSSEFDDINAEQKYLSFKERQLAALGDNIHAILGLIRALGGGFDSGCE